MKQIIIIVGNMGSGKSTFAQAIVNALPGFEYVCLDDNRRRSFEDLLEEKFNQFSYENKVADMTIKELNRYDKIVYETTGATRFFKNVYYDLTVAKHKIYIVKIHCRPATCLSRHKARESAGHFHIVPQFGQTLTPEELINRFEEKAAWIKPDLVLDSEADNTDIMLRRFMQAYFPTDAEVAIKDHLANFNYQAAFDWFVQHVPGKGFVKQILSTGEDNYNRETLKKELAARLEYLKSEPTGTQSQPPTPDTQHPTPNRQQPTPNPQQPTANSQPPTPYPLPLTPNHPSPLLSKDELKAKWSPLYREAHYIFTQLDHEPDAERRRQMVLKILDQMDEVSEIWKEQDFIAEYGKVPKYENAGMEQLSPEQLATRIRTLRTYISKTRKGILKKDIPTLEKEIDDLTQLMHAV